MPEHLLFPRLPAAAAERRLLEVTGRSVPDLTALASVTHPDIVWAPTGGIRAPEAILEAVREQLLVAARELGFPQPARREILAAFDFAAARLLWEHLPICPGEASRDEFWSFVALVLAPDLATWRFPDQNRSRFLGGNRNAFQRCWWRAALLHEPTAKDPWSLLQLPEDALVGLMERPGISSNASITRVIARGIAGIAARLPGHCREDGWRDAYKRVRQRFPLVNLDALSHAEVEAQIEHLCLAAEAHVLQFDSLRP